MKNYHLAYFQKEYWMECFGHLIACFIVEIYIKCNYLNLRVPFWPNMYILNVIS